MTSLLKKSLSQQVIDAEKETSNALDIFTKTVDKLQVANQKIEDAIKASEEEKKLIEDNQKLLKSTASKNAKIISKINEFLS